MKEKTAIDKLRNIVAWANNMDENFNSKVRNPMDWITIAYLADEYDIEFVDDLDYYDEDHKAFAESINSRLGYKLFNL